MMAKETRTPPPINVGHKRARECFQLITGPAYSQFKEIQTRKSAIECAKTLENVRGWWWCDAHPGINPRDQKRKFGVFTVRLFAECPALELIRDIAESAKHGGQLGRESTKVRAIEGEESPSGRVVFDNPFHNPSRPGSEALLKSTLKIALWDGSEEKLSNVLERAVEFWRTKLL